MKTVNCVLTGHDLEAIESAALEIGDGLVGLVLLLGAPGLNVVEDINPGRILGLDSDVLLLAEHGSVHCGEVDDGDR